jgi:hypothetical protein
MSEVTHTDVSNRFHKRLNERALSQEQLIEASNETPIVDGVKEYDGQIEYEKAYSNLYIPLNDTTEEDIGKRFERMEAERKKSVETLAEEYQEIQLKELKERSLDRHSYSKTDLDTKTTLLLYAYIIISLPVLAVMVPINKVRNFFRNRSKIAVE